jgi:hypothetical protein
MTEEETEGPDTPPSMAEPYIKNKQAFCLGLVLLTSVAGVTPSSVLPASSSTNSDPLLFDATKQRDGYCHMATTAA